MQKWEHCKLVGKKVTVLGKGLFKHDRSLTEYGAWNELGDQGWELVSVVANEEGEEVFYFKRSVIEEE